MKSLRVRLVLVLCVTLCALWSGMAAWMFSSMRHELLQVLDDRLIASTRMVAGIVQQFAPEQMAPRATTSTPDWLSVVGRDGVACEVSLVRGEVERLPIARTANSPGFSEVQAAGFGRIVKGGKAWRTYVLEEDGIRITTADRIDVREHLVLSFALALVLPFLLVLVGIVLLTWWSCNVGLEPLRKLQQALAQRPPLDSSPVQAGQDVVELAPMVNSLNALLARMNAAIAHERRWSADAAHELRTPLTAIKTHVQIAQLLLDRERPASADAAAQASQSLAQAAQGIAHMQGALEQLLALARVESGDAQERVCTEGTDIVAALALACDQSRQRAADQGLADSIAAQLSPDAPQAWAGVRLALAAPLLTCAITNLLDNALRHHRGPQPVRATLRLHAGAPPRVVLSVQDEGQGMTAQECEHAVQRFWRKNPSDQGGGLGLTIVQRIALSAGGNLRLHAATATQTGLLAELTLPVEVRA